MNLLTESLPSCLKIDGREYRINADFRVFIKFELRMQDSTVPDEIKIMETLDEFYRGEIPDDLCRAMNEFIRVYSCERDTNKGNGGEQSEKNSMVYSYEHDADAIYAAFLQTYGIDLTAAELHWYKFRALMGSLPDDCEFMRACRYRTLKIDSDLPLAEKRRLGKLKKYYALPDNRTTAQKEQDFAADFAAFF